MQFNVIQTIPCVTQINDILQYIYDKCDFFFFKSEFLQSILFFLIILKNLPLNFIIKEIKEIEHKLDLSPQFLVFCFKWNENLKK